jgi:hypothetical protein
MSSEGVVSKHNDSKIVQIKVFEQLSLRRRILGFFLTVGVFFFALVVAIQGIGMGLIESGAISVTVGAALMLLLILGSIFLIMFLVVFTRPKVTATPLLGERTPTMTEQDAWMYGGLVGVLFYLLGRVEFILCEEGVVIYGLLGRTLYRWHSFRSFTANNKTRRFKLKLNSRRSITLTALKNFEEVDSILSQKIPPPPP